MPESRKSPSFFLSSGQSVESQLASNPVISSTVCDFLKSHHMSEKMRLNFWRIQKVLGNLSITGILCQQYQIVPMHFEFLDFLNVLKSKYQSLLQQMECVGIYFLHSADHLTTQFLQYEELI